MCESIRSLIALSWTLQVIAKVRSANVHSLTRSALLASLLLPLSRHGPYIVRRAQLFHRRNGFIQLVHPSRCSQPILTEASLCLCTATTLQFCRIGFLLSMDPTLHYKRTRDRISVESSRRQKYRTDFIPTSAQFFAASAFLILRPPS